jgi:hypothetical protein
MITINLPNEYIYQPQLETMTVTVAKYVDNPEYQWVMAHLCMNDITSPDAFYIDLMLWEGQEYVDIGQWTDDEAEARIIQLLS